MVLAVMLPLGLPAEAQYTKSKEPPPRNLPETAGMSEKQLREVILELSKRLDSLEDDIKAMKLQEKLRELENKSNTAATGDAGDPAANDTGPLAMDDAATTQPADEDPAAKDKEAEKQAGLTPAKTFFVKITAVNEISTVAMERDLENERNRTSNYEERIRSERERLQQMDRSRTHTGWDRDGDSMIERTYSGNELGRQRRAVQQAEREKQKNLQKIRSLEYEIEKAKTTVSIVGVTVEDGLPITVTARHQIAEAARNIIPDYTYRVDGSLYRTTPVREVIARSIVPIND